MKQNNLAMQYIEAIIERGNAEKELSFKKRFDNFMGQEFPLEELRLQNAKNKVQQTRTRLRQALKLE